ncbi:MAG: radical SAM protein, partial [Candidatus Woesearchaeota archaeon]
MVHIGFMQFYDIRNHSMIYPGAGSAQIYGYLRENDYNFSIIPLVKTLLSSPRLTESFFGEQQSSEVMQTIFDELYDSLGLGDFDVLCVAYNSAVRHDRFDSFVRSIRMKDDAPMIVVGGLQDQTDMLLKDSVCDYVVDGLDSPETLKKVIDNMHDKAFLRKLPGLSYLDATTDKVVDNPAEDKNALYPYHYYHAEVETGRLLAFNACKFSRFTTVFTESVIMYRRSEGCNRHCLYCFNTANPLSTKSDDEVVKNIKHIINTTGSRYFFLLQNVISDRRVEAEEFCASIKPLNILWSSSIAPKRFMDESYFRMLRDSGCVRLQFAIDTASEPLMKLYNRHVSLDDFRR